jgi:phage shock protein PspC (stress-responsive transcriptional regulator)
MTDTPNTLDRLEEMRADGRIDEEEYQALRDAILGGKAESGESGADETRSDAPREEHAAPKRMQRLHRRADKAMIGGVCAGVGERFDIKPGIVRALWVLVTIFSGPFSPWIPPLAYIVLWAALPVEGAAPAPVAAGPPVGGVAAAGSPSEGSNLGRGLLIALLVIAGATALYLALGFSLFPALRFHTMNHDFASWSLLPNAGHHMGGLRVGVPLGMLGLVLLPLGLLGALALSGGANSSLLGVLGIVLLCVLALTLLIPVVLFAVSLAVPRLL